jgi:phage gp46-like protein
VTDTSTIWNPGQLHGDWNLVGAQLQSGGDLETAFLISLFTDRVANIDDVIPDGTTDPRGWWADDQERPIGSRLWLLERVKLTNAVAARAKDYAAEALKWLIDDGVLVRIDITTEIILSNQLRMRVIGFASAGSKAAIDYQWVQQGFN